MQEENQESQSSQVLFMELAKSLAELFPIDTEYHGFDDLIKKLDRVNINRELSLDITHQRLTKLLSNTANQSI